MDDTTSALQRSRSNELDYRRSSALYHRQRGGLTSAGSAQDKARPATAFRAPATLPPATQPQHEMPITYISTANPDLSVPLQPLRATPTSLLLKFPQADPPTTSTAPFSATIRPLSPEHYIHRAVRTHVDTARERVWVFTVMKAEMMHSRVSFTVPKGMEWDGRVGWEEGGCVVGFRGVWE